MGSLLRTEAEQGPRRAGKVEVNLNRRNRNQLYHHSLDSMVSQKLGNAWQEKHHQDKFKRLFHAATEFPKDLENKIWGLTGGDLQGDTSLQESGALPEIQTSRQACPPVRTLLARRTSVDLSILKLKVYQKLLAVYELNHDRSDNSLHEKGFKKAIDMMKLRQFSMGEIRRDLNRNANGKVRIGLEDFLKLVAKRIDTGTNANRVKKHQQVVNALDRFQALNAHLLPIAADEDGPGLDHDPDLRLTKQKFTNLLSTTRGNATSRF